MNNTVFITGTSSGIGRATAKRFHAKGWNVVATMRAPREETELDKLDNVLVVRLDVTDPDSIADAVNEAIEAFGSIGALVNNAGYAAFGPLEAFSTEQIRRQFETNVIGMLEVTKAILPRFREQRSGTIVNLSSLGGKVTFPLGTLYHGTKFAVEGLSEALHYELEPVGVRVKIVEPGVVATDFTSRLDFANDERLVEYQTMVHKVMHGYGDLVAAGSPPESVAEVIWTAVTDNRQTLRYTVGEDAIELIARRRDTDDATFFGGLKAQLGL